MAAGLASPPQLSADALQQQTCLLEMMPKRTRDDLTVLLIGLADGKSRMDA